MATLDELRREPHWSYSALNTYLNICQLQYFFRYVEHAEVERTSACFPFGRAFHAALSAQAWECVMGGSLTRTEIVARFAEIFALAVEASPNLLYKEGENFASMLALAERMLDVALANWSDFYTIKGVAQPFRITVPGLNKPLIGEYDLLIQDGRDNGIVDWKSSASRWPVGKADRDLQATVFSYAYHQEHDAYPLFRFDVITKAKSPSCESHYTSRNAYDFRRFEVLANKAQQAIDQGVFLPNESCFACGECPYKNRCQQWKG